MLHKSLKYLRIILAVVSITCISLVFVNIYATSERFKFFADIQFIPSLLHFLQTPTWAACAFIVILIVTLLIGRIYCSIICPLGILQDIFSRLGKITKIRKKYSYREPLNILRYTILLLTIITFITGFFSLIPWLDPYSIFGRIATHLFRPIVYAVNNLIAGIGIRFGSYAVPYLTPKGFNLSVIIISGIYLIIIALMSIFRGRLYCNTICPVGALLSLVSRYQIFGIHIGDHQKWIRCRKCGAVCKSECLEMESLSFDYSRCISCFNCIGPGVCKFSLPKFSFLFKKNERQNEIQQKSDTGRRQFLMMAAIPSAVALLGLRMKSFAQQPEQKKIGQIAWKRKHPITPPGSISLEHFLKYCTACHACVNVCPSKVIQPTLMEYGFKGMMVPQMQFHTAFCNYECHLCGQICPTDAIWNFSIEQKKIVQIGKVQFIPENCVSFVYERHCGACAEHCPTRAIQMISGNGKAKTPQINRDLCIGCGACEYICPTRPYQAIYVESLENHGIAQLYEQEQQENREYKQEDFPF